MNDNNSGCWNCKSKKSERAKMPKSLLVCVIPVLDNYLRSLLKPVMLKMEHLQLEEVELSVHLLVEVVQAMEQELPRLLLQVVQEHHLRHLDCLLTFLLHHQLARFVVKMLIKFAWNVVTTIVVVRGWAILGALFKYIPAGIVQAILQNH